jgi:hypothetical protein
MGTHYMLRKQSVFDACEVDVGCQVMLLTGLDYIVFN